VNVTHMIPEWGELMALAFCIGTLVCRIWVLPTLAGNELPPQGNQLFSMWRPFGICMAAMLASGIADLLMRSVQMSGRPFSEICSVLPIVLSQTHYGHVWLVRISTLVLSAITLMAGRRHLDSRNLQFSMLILFLVVSMTLSASGHSSNEGDFSIPEIMDWLHLVAASVWGGGLFVLSIVILPRLVKPDTGQEVLIADVARQFSTIAGIFVGVMLITALYNAWHFVSSVSAFWKTPYGRIAGVKAVLLLPLLLLGAFNRYINVPLLQQWAGLPLKYKNLISRFVLRLYGQLKQSRDGRLIPFRFMNSVRVEAVLIAGLLFWAALLRHEIPSRHAAHFEHSGKEAPSHQSHEDGGMHHHY
jgi:putative copper resistance protein D